MGRQIKYYGSFQSYFFLSCHKLNRTPSHYQHFPAKTMMTTDHLVAVTLYGQTFLQCYLECWSKYDMKSCVVLLLRLVRMMILDYGKVVHCIDRTVTELWNGLTKRSKDYSLSSIPISPYLVHSFTLTKKRISTDLKPYCNHFTQKKNMNTSCKPVVVIT